MLMFHPYDVSLVSDDHLKLEKIQARGSGLTQSTPPAGAYELIHQRYFSDVTGSHPCGHVPGFLFVSQTFHKQLLSGDSLKLFMVCFRISPLLFTLCIFYILFVVLFLFVLVLIEKSL